MVFVVRSSQVLIEDEDLLGGIIPEHAKGKVMAWSTRFGRLAHPPVVPHTVSSRLSVASTSSPSSSPLAD